MAKSGHTFPSSAGFTNSTGKTQSVKGYSRSIPVKKAIGGIMPGPQPTSGPKMLPPVRPMPVVPMAGRRGVMPTRPGALAYAAGGHVKVGDMKAEIIGDQGNSVVKRGKPFITEFDKDHGGTASLRTGYKKGGKIKTVAKQEIAKHVAAPAPKGHKGFNKLPMFGKK